MARKFVTSWNNLIQMKLKTRIKHLKNRLAKKALRDPRTKREIRIRVLYERVNNIWRKRYEKNC